MILAYHSISSRRLDALAVSPSALEWQIGYVAKRRRLVSLGDYAAALESGSHTGLCAVTFDDGYQDNLGPLVRLVREAGVPATVFVSAGLLGRRQFPTRGIPDTADPALYRLLDEGELKDLAAVGVAIGSHGMTHVRLAHSDVKEARQEIFESKRVLEDLVQQPVEFFCYPAGDQGAGVRRLVAEAGYVGAVVTPRGPCQEDRFTLNRVGVYRHDSRARFALKISPLFPWLRDKSGVWMALRGMSDQGRRAE